MTEPSKRVIRRKAAPGSRNGVSPRGPQPDVMPAALKYRYGFDEKTKELGEIMKGKNGEPRLSLFSYRPITITMKLVDLDTEVEYWELTWLTKDSGPRRLRIEREVAKSRTKLAQMDAFGLPSIPEKTTKLARYLADVEATVQIPRGYVTSHFGWQSAVDEVERWFLWGEKPIVRTGVAAPPLGLQIGTTHAKDLVRACRSKGSFAAWKQTIAVIEPYAVPVIALLTALASPMLRVLHAGGWITDLAATTSTGKTTTLTVAGSAVGQPEVKGHHRGTVVLTMKSASNVGFELVSAMLGSLPVLIDDSKTAKRRDLIEALIYQQSGGSGSMRSTPDAKLKDTPKWLSSCVTTGEAPLALNSGAGGAAARIVSLPELPFGPTTPETGALVTKLYDGVLANYGWALPALVQYVIDHQGDWTSWRDALEQEEQRFMSSADADGAVRRQAEFYAVLSITGRVAYEAGVLPFDPLPRLNAMWEQLATSGEDLDKPRMAMKALRQWVDHNGHLIYDNTERCARQERPPDRPTGTYVKYDASGVREYQFWDKPPFSGWAGVREVDFIALVPARLKAILDDLGFEDGAVRTAWRDAGWLKTSDAEPTKTTCKYRPPLGGAATRYVCVLLGETDDL